MSSLHGWIKSWDRKRSVLLPPQYKTLLKYLNISLTLKLMNLIEKSFHVQDDVVFFVVKSLAVYGTFLKLLFLLSAYF